MARIAGINIPPHKHTEIGLTVDLRHWPYHGAEDLHQRWRAASIARSRT